MSIISEVSLFLGLQELFLEKEKGVLIREVSLERGSTVLTSKKELKRMRNFSQICVYLDVHRARPDHCGPV